MIDFPREPNPGESLDASWGSRVVRALRALFPMPGPGINVSTGPTGTTISAAASHVARAKSDGDGAVIGIIQQGTTGDGVSYGNEVNSHYMTAYVYPAWPEQTGRYLVRVYTPCVYRRSPLMPGDPVLLHPCAVGVTTEGEDT